MLKMLKIQCTYYNTVNCMHVEDVEDYLKYITVVTCTNVKDVEDI